MAIKVLIVEDENGIRMLLKKIIEKHEGFEVVGESANLETAISLFKKHRPELVFLDIEINGESGIDCAKIIEEIDPKAKIVFATAHTEYMLDAFELYAFDYLIKPFDMERVNRTLDKVLALTEPQVMGYLDQIVRFEKNLDKLLIKGKESMCFVDINTIILVQREEGRTVIYTKDDSFTTSVSLNEVEAKLDQRQFLRSHKSYLINISKIKRIEPYGRWTYTVIFSDIKTDALMTVEKYEEIKKKFL